MSPANLTATQSALTHGTTHGTTHGNTHGTTPNTSDSHLPNLKATQSQSPDLTSLPSINPHEPYFGAR